MCWTWLSLRLPSFRGPTNRWQSSGEWGELAAGVAGRAGMQQPGGIQCCLGLRLVGLPRCRCLPGLPML